MKKSQTEFYCPDELKNVPLEMGIDEAGRGPVLGPMLYCAAFAKLNYEWPSSVNDSKQLTSDKRASILKKLEQLPVGFVVKSISAAEISAICLSRGQTSLNTISFQACQELVQRAIDEGLDIKTLYVDTVGKEESYQSLLERRFPKIKITVAAKGDSKFKCVGAASIHAKVRRDKEMEDFTFEEPNIKCDRNFGSGYPGDAVTKQWLEKNFDPVFGYPSIVRFSWNTVSMAFEQKNATALFEAPERKTVDSAFFVTRNLRSASFE
ncbi:Ribonuclease H2 subunit A [Tritrichomonas foetus]|uniref:Ribonuclease n=1 Tax=Tritrichomonas foetus TaxID=1144522 RepID=A0A1J4KBG5_9EUKA|nr:Ribonuclease H2 subunit A [Tritrichomonas foetus]|eukprot:OHT08563.1 Ribonuclease H2 subunit A [Tritrichomonas foetus]